MKTEICTLDKNQTTIRIETNPENPEIQISYRLCEVADSEKVTNFMMQCFVTLRNGKKDQCDFYVSSKQNDLDLPNGNIDFINFEIFDTLPANSFVELEVRKGRKLINLQNPISEFSNFIYSRVNSRILFSAPFGQGKTTFLNHFFDEVNKENYTVFRTFPVNYSVATNEDIFRYIKTDILFQLLAYDVEFDKTDINLAQSFQEYAYLNPVKTIVSFLKNISRLNSSTEVLSKSIDSLNDFLEPVREYQKKESSDDKEKATDYLKEVYEKEGSLFEDNFFTQLIRQLLERIKAETKRPNVLIIEDLDRMDPDHIFRILNVISAHFDTNQKSGNVEYQNKFGFDKIILVCDLNNIRSIFHHKYGVNTSFRGYIDKYFSSKPFEFSCLDGVKLYLENLVDKISLQREKDPRIKVYGVLIRFLLESEQLSLREMLKLINDDFENYTLPTLSGVKSYCLENGTFYRALSFLISNYNANELKFKITSANSKKFSTKIHFHNLSLLLLAGLGDKHEIETETGLNCLINTNYKGNVYKMSFNEHFMFSVFTEVKLEKPEFNELMVANNAGNPIKEDFDKEDFVDLLVMTIDKVSSLR